MTPRLINFEGIDCCGKTTLSKMLASKLEYVYSHEPGFSSATADKLNSNIIDCWRREFYFMKDRIEHQSALNTTNVVLDRYILSGLAYAETFSPQTVPMMKSIYSMKDEFKEPDVVVFIDIAPEDAIKFNELKKGTPDYSERMDIIKLQIIINNFKKHFQFIRELEVPLVIIKPTIGDLDKTLAEISEKIQLYI